MIVDQFSQLTRSIADLKALAVHMWAEYSEPLDKVSVLKGGRKFDQSLTGRCSCSFLV
jgi:hypothetical protein